jgi:ketosteroid isomerase-like protein
VGGKRALEVLREYQDAWSRGDVEAGCSYFDETLVVHMGGNHPTLSRDYHGGADFVQGWVDKVAGFADSWIVGGEAGEADVLVESDSAVVLMVREMWARGEKRVRTSRMAVYRFNNEKIVECWFNDMRQAEVDEFFSDLR